MPQCLDGWRACSVDVHGFARQNSFRFSKVYAPVARNVDPTSTNADTCCGRCTSRYCPTTLISGSVTLRYTPIDYAKRIGRSSIRPVRDTIGFLSLIVRTVMYFKPLKIFAPVSAMLFVLAITVAVMTKLLLGQVADVTSVTLALASVQMLAIGLLADLIDKRSPSYS